jgi:hypothetical protein
MSYAEAFFATIGWGEMAEAIGLSVGATRFAGVQHSGTAVTRQSVLTLYHQRPPELGVPGENPNLTQPGLVVTGFVERVGDPVGMVAADGSMHRGELLVADALRELLHTVTGGRPPAKPAVVTHPAHWPRTAVDALRSALAHVPEWSRGGQPITLVSDAAAAISALQSDPGVPSRGVIALCDFGGTGTSLTLLDASREYAPLGPTIRDPDFSGDLIDQALLTHLIADLSPVAAVDATGTSALGRLQRLRSQCGGAKERLSSSTVTTLTADLPGYRGDVRLTRIELDEQIRRPLDEFVGVLRGMLDRNGVHPADLVAVASTGGGARIPIITTTLSERFRVPVITTPRPELAAASGAALRAAWGPADDRATAIAPAAAAAATMAAPVFADADALSSTFRALAWSEAHDVPPVAPPAEELYDPEPASAQTGLSSARPQLEFTSADAPPSAGPRPWYRRPSTLVGVAASALLLLSASAVVAFGSDTRPASNTSPVPPSSAAPAVGAAASPAPAASPGEPQSQDPARRTVFVSPPPATQYQAPAPQQVVAPPPQQVVAPPPAAPAPEAPPPAPSSDVPPPPAPETTTVTTTAPPPTFTTTVTAPPTSTAQPPVSQPTTQASAPAPPPSSTQPPVTLTLPPLPTVPGVLNPSHN